MNWKFLWLCALGSLALLSGCGGAPKTATVDVKAYGCNGCKTKFYTTDGLNADHCPQCKQGDIVSVVTYVCPTDKQKTIAARSREGTRCKQCNTIVSVFEYPAEEDLKAWGAVEKKRAEVTTAQ